MCVKIVEILFGIVNGRLSLIFDKVICPPHKSGGVVYFHIFYFDFLTLARDNEFIGKS